MIFCFYLYLKLYLDREFTYYHIFNNVIRLALSDVSFVFVFVVLKLTFVLWYLSVAAVRRLIYFLTIANLCLLYTSDAADEEDSVDLGGRRIIKKKENMSCLLYTSPSPRD